MGYLGAKWRIGQRRVGGHWARVTCILWFIVVVEARPPRHMPSPSNTLTIGLMSGTSLDGVDAVLLACSDHGMQCLSHTHLAFDPALRQALDALNQPGTNELHRAALAGNALAHTLAQAVTLLLQRTQTPKHQVNAIGAHGQTVRHQPGQHD